MDHADAAGETKGRNSDEKKQATAKLSSLLM